MKGAPASGKHEILLCVPICLIHSESCRIRMNFEQQPGRQGAFLSGGDMKRLLVTVKPFNGTIPFRVLQRGRVLVKDIFSGKCTEFIPGHMKWMPRMKKFLLNVI